MLTGLVPAHQRQNNLFDTKTESGHNGDDSLDHLNTQMGAGTIQHAAVTVTG
jgi:hypothetical protein